MLRRLAGFLLIFCSFALLPSGAIASTWRAVTWNGEKAWQSDQGKQRAIVSEARSRVIYLGSLDGQHNLLSAPAAKEDPTPKRAAPNWGGHRFWLGPQTRWKWPPPKDWEFSSASRAEIHDDRITLEEPRLDPAYPALQREYQWEGDRLRCTARWRSEGRPYYGMHVVAIEAPATIETELFAWSDVPLGFLGVRGDTPNLQPLPNPAVQINGARATITNGKATVKLGFFPQTLKVNRGNWTLLMYPGASHGIPLASPDHGYLSQVWVGDSSADFCELEQITPYLIPAADGWCSSTIYLQAQPGGDKS